MSGDACCYLVGESSEIRYTAVGLGHENGHACGFGPALRLPVRGVRREEQLLPVRSHLARWHPIVRGFIGAAHHQVAYVL